MKTPNKDKSMICVRFSRDIRAAVEKAAEAEDRSLSNVMVRYIRAGLIKDGYLQQ